MRAAGAVLFLVGLVALAGGLFFGCGSFFSWNGRHPVAVHPFAVGKPLTQKMTVKAGRRYTASVQVVFDRASSFERAGQIVVEAKMPLRASIKSAAGEGPEVVGWFDPSEPPTVLYGHAPNEGERRPPSAAAPELVAQRLVGPWLAASDGEATFAADLGEDRVGTARIQEIRLVVYDDVVPSAVRLPFYAAGGGALACVVGAVLFVVGVVRGRRGGGGTRQRKNV